MSMAIYSRFANLLDYPGPDTAARVEACLTELGESSAEGRAELERFLAEIAGMTPGRLEEAYTQTFELRPESTPNLGYHLFGDDVRRSIFMAHLKQRMKAQGVELGVELPDHWCLVLRLLARQESAEEIDALVDDCLLPAVARILKVVEGGRQAGPYSLVLHPLRGGVRRLRPAVAPRGSGARGGSAAGTASCAKSSSSPKSEEVFFPTAARLALTG